MNGKNNVFVVNVNGCIWIGRQLQQHIHLPVASDVHTQAVVQPIGAFCCSGKPDVGISATTGASMPESVGSERLTACQIASSSSSSSSTCSSNTQTAACAVAKQIHIRQMSNEIESDTGGQAHGTGSWPRFNTTVAEYVSQVLLWYVAE